MVFNVSAVDVAKKPYLGILQCFLEEFRNFQLKILLCCFKFMKTVSYFSFTRHQYFSFTRHQ